MRLNLLFSDVCHQLMQGKNHVKIPPGKFVSVTEEDGRKFLEFSANGMDFRAVFQGFKMWITRSDLSLVAAMENGVFVYCNPAYRL